MEKRLPNGTKVYIFKNEGWRPAFSEEYIEGIIFDSNVLENTLLGIPLTEILYYITDNNKKKHICLHNPSGRTAEYFRTHDELIEYINNRINEKENELSNLYKKLENLTNERIELKQNKQHKKSL